MTTPTIFALSTPPGRSAIAVIRLSGPHVGPLLDAMCPPRPRPRVAALRRLRDPATGDILDEALVLHFAAPKSETGEDMAELQVHGGRAIVQAVLETLSRFPGCRAAEPGEFAGRAFANGKLDLAQIEGLADLIDAETDAQRRQAVAQATGLQSKRFEAWRAELLAAMGLVEAAIDFSDEADVSERAVAQAEKKATQLRAELSAHLDDGHRGEILREGFRVVLAGPPNAGKSSLLNALARRDAAIVSDEAGTTRDVIDVRLDLEGCAVIISDTAGIRETSSSVEQEGIRRTLAAAREADLVLWLSEADPVTPPAPHQDTARELHILTKCDLVPKEWIHVKQPGGEGQSIHVKQTGGLLSSPRTGEDARRCEASLVDDRAGEGLGLKSELLTDSQSLIRRCAPPSHVPGEDSEVAFHCKPASAGFAISAKTGEGLDALTSHIAARARAAAGNPSDPAITRVRHRRELEAAVAHLDAFLANSASALELRAEDLRIAATALGRLTGRIGAEEVLGEIFSRFCIGK